MSLRVEETAIPGLLVVHQDLHHDDRGWFKESWHRAHMVELGLPDFGPVQHNVSFNARRGVTRGVHAEPWDKLVSVSAGRVFGAWVDLRAGESFGRVVHREIDPAVSVFVPRGVGNAYQTLEDATAYSYLVNAHWHPDASYVAVDLADPDAAIPWPIPLAESVRSAKDLTNPHLGSVVPFPPRRSLVIGAGGQLGRALVAAFPAADAVEVDQLDLTDPAAVAAWPWGDYDLVLNAAAWTAVDQAETDAGRTAAWAANANGPAALAEAARLYNFLLVHFSTDYVFDGERPEHTEDEPLAPLGVYGQSKAAGDLAVVGAPRHYVLRTSWLVGDGPNFVRTMQRLAADGVSPAVVDDQVGRLAFADEVARAVRHLLVTAAPYGTYHVTNGGPPMSWADVAREVFRLSGRAPGDVRRVSTEEYVREHGGAPRPRHSTLALGRLRATGFEPEDAATALARYCSPRP